ncbi:MAG: class II aldolase/adducin family protein [Sphingomonadaceae bacterium]
MRYAGIREEIVSVGRRMLADGLVTFTAGNSSVRIPGEDLVAITPSGRPYDTMGPEEVPIVTLDGRVVDGACRPSSEMPMHLAVYRHRPDVQAMVHTHSPHALAFAVARRPIPLISLEGLPTRAIEVLVAEYATPGTEEVGRSALAALERQPDSRAVLLANHGLLAVGGSLAEAYTVAANLETEARIYLLAATLGTAVALTGEQLAAIRRHYEAKKQ